MSTSHEPYIRIYDLVLRVFTEYLPHTPLEAFGINREIHFQLNNSGERDRIGRKLAPVTSWGAWGEKLGSDGKKGGMTSLIMTQINPEGRPLGGKINVKVEPSNRLLNGQIGVYVSVNDHYVPSNSGLGTTNELMILLEKNFKKSIQHSDEIIDHIMSLAKI